MKKRFGQIAASYLVLQKDGKILMGRRFNTGYHDGEYSLVAGHIEQNETARGNIVREAMEEAGIKIKLEDLKFVHVLHRPSDTDPGVRRIDFFWMVDKWEGEPKITESDKCDDISWFPLDDIPKNTIHYVKHALECIAKGIKYSEYGWKEWI